MSRLTQAGVTAGVALTLACASLSGPATASTPQPASAAAPGLTAAATPHAKPDRGFTPKVRAESMKAAQAKASAIAKGLGLTGAQKLRATDVERDADGTLHLRYDRTLGGLQVIGGDLVVHVSPDGKVSDADFASDQPLTLDTTVDTKVSATRAAGIAAKAAAGKAQAAKKVVWAVDGIPRLAWITHVRSSDRSGFAVPRAVAVDARTGAVIQKWDLHQEATGRGKSLYSGTVNIATVKQKGKYLLKDASRGNSVTINLQGRFENPPGSPPFATGPVFKDKDNVWGNGKPGNEQSAAVDVAYGSAKTWDFYKKTFHRNGIANNGKGAKSRVHFANGYDNAFWSDACFCMTYGDGGQFFKPLVELDVAGHEMTHGVTSHTAGLLYFGDAGGLNESTSDIFGTLVEFFAKNKSDKGDYYIGEKIAKPALGTPYLRRMDNPHLDSVSFNCWGLQMGLADPHYTSGPGNHFFYLLAEGSGPKTIGGRQHNSPVCAGAAAVQGIGRAKAGAIWYRALTRYFVSTTGYIDARDNTIRAAIDLYGKNSAECKQVVKAWNAIDVPSQYWTCTGGIKEGANTFGASPGFEQTPNTAWGHTGTAWLIDNGQFSTPRSGKRNGLLNSFGSPSDGSFTHEITVPDTDTAMLRFYMMITIARNADASLTSGTGTVDVYFNGNPLGHFDESYANATYQRWDIPIDAFRGQTGTLSIVGHEDAPNLPGGIFAVSLDDFTLTPR